MIEATCINREIDKYRRVHSYTLQDNHGNKLNIEPEALKNAIKSNRIYVTNMEIAADGRLMSLNRKSYGRRRATVRKLGDNQIGKPPVDNNPLSNAIIKIYKRIPSKYRTRFINNQDNFNIQYILRIELKRKHVDFVADQLRGVRLVITDPTSQSIVNEIAINNEEQIDSAINIGIQSILR